MQIPNFDAQKSKCLVVNAPTKRIKGSPGPDVFPSGVLLHHRGAYLKSVHLIVKWPLHRHCVYLWTVPIFHLNGG